jgi:hypothetical protein
MIFVAGHGWVWLSCVQWPYREERGHGFYGKDCVVVVVLRKNDKKRVG